MDAATRIPDVVFEKAQQQTQMKAQPIEDSAIQQAKKTDSEVKTPLEEGVAVDANNRFVLAAINKANKQMMSRDTSLQFEPYDRTGDMIVRIIDTNTKEVIREIPSKKILDMVANMLEMAGLLVDEKR